MGIVWKWQDDRGQFNSYNMEISCVLESAYNNRLKSVDLSSITVYPSASYPYIIDLMTMSQIRKDTGFRRTVARSTAYNKYTRFVGTSQQNKNLVFSFGQPNTSSSTSNFNFSHQMPFSTTFERGNFAPSSTNSVGYPVAVTSYSMSSVGRPDASRRRHRQLVRNLTPGMRYSSYYIILSCV